ncbi:uncharacterized protein [Drosophila kikkawai]|uniref:RIIa domain-containing protein n=1 Tax=Drosophila kikkawai TaxID=30033 RepID=A0ABM4GI08_DROKI
MTTTSLPRVPEGLRDLMKVYTKEVLREKPADLYGFSAKFFNLIVAEKSHQVVRKYEPVQTYETIMKNRIKQQVPISMVFNIIPETLTDLIKKFIKAVLREKPENIYIFAQEYFQRLSKEKSGRIEYTKYSTYEKSIKDKENIAPVSKVTCECGRVLSAQSKDLTKAVSTETTKLGTTITEETTLSSSISYVKSVVVIQRHFRRYLKQKKIGREKNKCNSVEYMTAIILIQRQFRRVLAKRRVEKLKKSRPGQLSYVKFNAANYMKAVVVIQRHYRIYLKRKQEQNRLKNGPVSLATAALIIQRAFRRMVAVRRARRTASVTADPGEELNDNASETGSYTSVSTALLSTESTELGMANYEEKVHQKIIHEDEEVENNNVDASLEKEYLAETIKGDDKSIGPRKSEILGLEREKDLNSELSGIEAEKPLSPVIEDEFTPMKESKRTGSAQETAIKTNNNSLEIKEENEMLLESDSEKPAEIEDEFTAIKAGSKLDSSPETAEIEDEFTAIKAGSKEDSSPETELSKKSSLDLQEKTNAELKTLKASIEELQLEIKDDLKAIKDQELENEVKTEDGNEDSANSKEIEDSLHKQEEDKDKDILIKATSPLTKLTNSESQEVADKPIKTEVTPKVSIEVELVDDVLEEDLSDPYIINPGNELSEGDYLEEQPRSMPTVEIDSLKTVLTNHNREVQKQAPILEEENTVSLSGTDPEIIPTESKNTKESEIPIPDRPGEATDPKQQDDKPIPLTESSSSKDTPNDILESLEETKPESDLKKEDSVADPSASQIEDAPSDRETKPKEFETSKVEQSKQTSSLEDTITPTSNEKVPTSTPSQTEKKSSLLVSNQLIGTQNLPTNRNEIEKNTKKLSSASVKDKDIGTSGRLVPTPIAELQLKSFKAPNDDGAWYDIYVEPQQPSDKDLHSPPPAASVSTNQTEKKQDITPEMEPIVVAERVPSYYTPKEILEPSVPKAKNSISFFVSFDSDDGKPKYKIPKKFRDQSKSDTLADTKSDPEPENNEEDIEVIEVSEGDPEYQQMGGSKLQTIMELNENECNNEGSTLHGEETESSKDLIDKEKSDSESFIRSGDLKLESSTKTDTEHYESVYKTDILNLTRSVQIIERAYRRFKNRRSLKRQEITDNKKKNNAAKVIQKWVRDFLIKKSPKVTSDISRGNQESLAARKIQRAYRRYVEKAKEEAEKEKRAALIIQKAFRAYSQKNLAKSKNESSDNIKLKENQAARKIQRAYRRYLRQANKPKVLLDSESEPIQVYKSTENNASPKSSALNPDEIKEENITQEDNSRPSSSPVEDLSDLSELNQHQAADKIQRAYKRYLQKTHKPKVILDSELEEPITVYKSTEVTSNEVKEEVKTQEANSKPSSSHAQDLSGLTELNQHQAAEKIQGAFRRYLKKSKKAEIKDFKSKDSVKIDKPIGIPSQSESLSKDEGNRTANAALIIQKAFRQYMERRKLENLDEISLDSITSSRITAIENSLCPTEGTPSDSLIQEEIPSEDATQISPKSEWFVGSTRIVPSQEVVEEPLELETEPDPAEITRKTELDTSTQVESVETVDRSHGSLESKLTPGIISSEIDENQANTSKQDNAVSSGLAGLTEAPEAGSHAEDQVLLSQSDIGSIFQTLDMASTQELVNDFLMNEIHFSSAQGPYMNGKQLQEVVEEPCIKRSASRVSLSEGETGNDSSKSEATGLDTLSADTIDKATVKLSKPEEVIEKMAQLRDSKSSERILSAEPSLDEPIVRPMSSLQEQASLDIEDGDIIVYNRLQRDETRESSAQSDSVVFGEAESDKILDRELATEEESGRVHLMRHYTIAGDDPRGLFRSVTIDDALSYGEMAEKDLDSSLGINSTNSFYLDDETSENIRKKMMAYSLSETDSDYFDPKKMSKEDFDIDTAMADAMGTSTETESTIVSAATKIQAGARGFLTRRRLRRASAGTKSSTMDTKASFGNDAISESLERFIEEEAAKKIQAAYRIHTRKRKGNPHRMEGISLESNLAARRQKLQRGDALRNDSTPDDENSGSTNSGQTQKLLKNEKRTKAVGEAKSRAAMELKWLTMRQNSMPVQIDCEVFRVIPKHMRKRIKSAEAGKRK